MHIPQTTTKRGELGALERKSIQASNTIQLIRESHKRALASADAFAQATQQLRDSAQNLVKICCARKQVKKTR